MLDGAGLSRDRTNVFNGDRVTVNIKNDWFDTLTGRIGYAFAPSWLLYGQGGAVWAKNSAEVHINGDDLGTLSKTRTGWTAGGGIEWMFAPNWSAFLEGNFMDFGSNDRNINTAVGTVCASGCSFSTKRPRPLSGRRELQYSIGEKRVLIRPSLTEPNDPEFSSGFFY
jgi:opacity protein-like surface antigen